MVTKHEQFLPCRHSFEFAEKILPFTVLDGGVYFVMMSHEDVTAYNESLFSSNVVLLCVDAVWPL